MVMLMLNVPLFWPVDVACALVNSLRLSLTITTVSVCGGTQSCPVTVITLPGIREVAVVETDSGFAASTVNGPSSTLLTICPLAVRMLQMLYSEFTCPAAEGQLKLA